MNPNARCIAHLAAGGLVLTPDLRLARILRRLHDRDQVAAGRQVWPTAQVLPVHAWLLQQWQQAAASRPELPDVLPSVALRWLWASQTARDAPGLLDPAELGVRARASWLRLRAHGGDLAAVACWPLTRDQQAFLGWARAVEAELDSRQVCDVGELARRMTRADALPAAGPPILLAGFRRMTPAEDALFSALANAGRGVERSAPSSQDAACFRHRSTDPESERRAMLAWLRDRVTHAPDGIHALIVPDLDSNRGALERALAASLQPELELPGTGNEKRSFDLAGGNPLAVQPVVDSALAAIACAAGAVDWTAASRLLLSAHVGPADAERNVRVAIDLALREVQGPLQINGTLLADRAEYAGASQMAQAIRRAVSAVEGQKRRDAGAWAEAFGACLAAWGWPDNFRTGNSRLSSREFEAARRFRELLQELATLAAVAPQIGVLEALRELRRLTAAPFQPESGEPTVFVLDAYDDPGVHFDSLWVAGLTAAAWPPAVSVDPLLPIEIQRQLGMPAVTPEACVAEARDIIGRWRSRAGAVVLSWPQFENDTETDGSPLLPADAVELALPGSPPSRERLSYEAAQLERVPEAAIPLLDGGPVKGGARLLELQAQCPFRAFAELRLAAKPLEEPQSGFDARLRGTVLHRVLQDLWGRLGSQRSLAALDETARSALVAVTVDVAITASTPAGTGLHTIELEREWQRRAVARLLELDLARPPFIVAEAERARPLTIAGLPLNLRVDRVDRMGEELIIIDYKTGRTHSSAWRGARMDAPQLPLYAVLHPDRPTGIAFAGIGAAAAKYVGVGREAGSFHGIEAAAKFRLTEDKQNGFSWAEITAHWRAWLERLAGDFAAGRVEVDPKLGASTCRYCHLAALCRVEPVPADDLEEEAADGE
ncbi:MAG: PD-(D/E)XK nuclease family protein [Pseudomonadota bacterium]|nr:PD-(D/E)XK nuclease family protein [Pseudomonadota bacterium]